MRIMIITNHSYMLYQFRKELIEKLLEEHEVIISTPFVGHEDDLKHMGCQMINTYVDRRGVNPLTDCQLLKSYRQLVKTYQPDQVITYSIKPNIYGGIICHLMNIPYYANVQGLGTAFQKKGLAQFVTILYKYAFKKVNIVFFENKGNAQTFIDRKIVPEEKITVLNGAGVNLERYQYQTYPETDKEVHFLFVGRIMKEKGVDELFEAMTRLHETYRDQVILDVVGFFEDEYKDTVEKLEAKGILKFHGFQQDVRPYYKNAHCVVLPSYHEGMSNVLLEAAASGRPLITTNIPGCREAVNDGETGRLCHVQDSQDLYQKMKQFLEMGIREKESMGKKARQKMEKEFDKCQIVNQTIKAIGDHEEWMS